MVGQVLHVAINILLTFPHNIDPYYNEFVPTRYEVPRFTDLSQLIVEELFQF